jgi:transcriptional regulator with XRE-family HTH domain
VERDPNAFVREVTRRIGQVRRTLGMTQEEAAGRLGTTVKNWQRIEAGQNLTLHTVARIALVLGVGPDELLIQRAQRQKAELPTGGATIAEMHRAKRLPTDENEFAFGLVQRVVQQTETPPTRAAKKKPATAKKRKWGREVEVVDPKTGRKKKFRFAAN